MTRGEILQQLADLLRRLYAESEGFLERQDDAQLWYNRGYANGMAQALRDLGLGAAVPRDLGLDIDDPDPREGIAAASLMPWGRAYAHGVEMGHRETHEVLEAE
jgi:hypothetical protein